MFYSNAPSVRRILLKIKKKPDQFEGGGEKERVAGGYEGARKKDPTNLKDPGRKKECPREGISLLLGHSVIVRR